jgi:hypothetical protein
MKNRDNNIFNFSIFGSVRYKVIDSLLKMTKEQNRLDDDGYIVTSNSELSDLCDCPEGSIRVCLLKLRKEKMISAKNGYGTTTVKLADWVKIKREQVVNLYTIINCIVLKSSTMQILDLNNALREKYDVWKS